MARQSGTRRRGFLVAGAAVVVLAAALAGGRTLHHQRLEALFDGPLLEETKPHTGFYAGLVYNLKGYLDDNATTAAADRTVTKSDFLEKMTDDPDWQAEEGQIHEEWKTDVGTGATKVARLRSETVYRERWAPRFLTITYPPDGAVFPPNLCSPFIEWGDVNNDLWQVTVAIPNSSVSWTYLTASCRWRIPDDVWAKLTNTYRNGTVHLAVKGVKRSGLWGKGRAAVHRSKVVTFRISKDRADNAVVYRLVDPPFVNKKTPDMFVRDIRQREPRLFLDARRTYCLNCHTFSSKTGVTGKLGLQVRYGGKAATPHPVYFAVYDIDRRHGRKTILPFEVQMTTFMAWSPDEAKLAFSANQKITAFNPIVFETQSVGQPTSDIAVYDVDGADVRLLEGAADPDVLEIYPYWTPDGKSIVYSSAPAGKHPRATQFDLRVIDYNDGRGGKSRPVNGASGNGKSHYYARFSPDGRWMTFVQSNYGSLIKASSDLWIMPGSMDGRARALECNVPHAADSWHSWSSNSRWIVFATKRDDGVFARLYMTHIDDEGKASPAVRLPLENPHVRMSFNIPEFVANVPPIEERRLFEGISLGADVLEVRGVAARGHEAEPD